MTTDDQKQQVFSRFLVGWLPFIINVFALIWGASAISTEVKHMSVVVQELKQNQFTQRDAAQYDVAQQLRYAELARRVYEIETTLKPKLR